MAFICGVVKVLNAKEREFDGRKYWRAQGLTDDKEVYNFSCAYGDYPKTGDTYQIIVEPDSNSKAKVSFVKEK